MREYFISARCVSGECLADFIQAPSFDSALRELERRAEERFGMYCYRVTGISENPALAAEDPRLLVFTGDVRQAGSKSEPVRSEPLRRAS
jgi:hypothetical protein